MSNLVVGATGHLGGEIAHRLLNRGEIVRALVRDPDSPSARKLQQAGAQLVIGDLSQPETLTQSCHGAQRVLATATAALSSDNALIERVDGEGYQALVREAVGASVERFVFVSAHGFDADSPVLLARAKAATEEALKSSPLNYVILRPTLFMESWIGLIVGAQLQADSTLRVIGSADKQYGFISLKNVADLMLAVTLAPEPEPVIPFSSGVVSYRQIARWVEEIQGRKLELQSLPLDTPVPGLPPIVNELWSLIASGDFMNLETVAVAATYAIELTSPEDFVRQNFGAIDATRI